MSTRLTAEEAEAWADQTRSRYQELQERLRGGDLSVTPGDLEKARDEAEYAVLASQGAKANDAREKEARLREAVRELQARAGDELDDTRDAVREKVQDIVDAVGGLADAIAAHQRTSAALSAEMLELHPEDVPLGENARLPTWYRTARSRVSGTRYDLVRLAVGAVVKGFDGRLPANTNYELVRVLRKAAGNAAMTLLATPPREGEGAGDRG
jgi:phage I-like protein